MINFELISSETGRQETNKKINTQQERSTQNQKRHTHTYTYIAIGMI